MLRQLIGRFWPVAAALFLAGLLGAGCVVDNSTGSSAGVLTYMKIRPDHNLHQNPPGTMYEAWVTAIVVEVPCDTGCWKDGVPSTFPDCDSVAIRCTVLTFIDTTLSLARFNWDPYLYQATDEDGNILPITSPEGMDIGFDMGTLQITELSPAVGYLTIEPLDDPAPHIPTGPTLMANNLNPVSRQGFLVSPFPLYQAIAQGQSPIGSYRVMSQSDKKGTGQSWRDTVNPATFGIWFANPSIDDSVVVDSPGGYLTYQQVISPPVGEAYPYTIWYKADHPESSLSNFGRVFDEREPDLIFTDGFPLHIDTNKFGPVGDRRDNNPPDMQLGSDPISVNGVIVGYRYVSADLLDTCILRIDDVSKTGCKSDTIRVCNDSSGSVDWTVAMCDTVPTGATGRDIDSVVCTDTSGGVLIVNCHNAYAALAFGAPDTTVREFTTIGGDTIVNPTLGGLPNLADPLNTVPQGAGFLYLGWEYEAWLVFTQASGIPPLSMGRFQTPRGFDRSNQYTNPWPQFDSNFAFPGEDFLNVERLSAHHSSLTGPIDVMNDDRVEKIWVTVEPVEFFDWEPDKPYTQQILFSQYVLKSWRGELIPVMQMEAFDINPSSHSLNEGNFFPTMEVIFLPPPAE